MDWIKSWLFDVEMKKGAQIAAQYAASYAVAKTSLLSHLGLTIHIDPAVMQVAILTGIHVLLNKLSAAFPNFKLLKILATPQAPAATPPS